MSHRKWGDKGGQKGGGGDTGKRMRPKHHRRVGQVAIFFSVVSQFADGLASEPSNHWQVVYLGLRGWPVARPHSSTIPTVVWIVG